MPIEYALRDAKVIVIKDSAITNVQNGSPLYSAGVVYARSDIAEGDTVAIVSQEGFLIALGSSLSPSEEMVKKKCVAAKVDRVM